MRKNHSLILNEILAYLEINFATESLHPAMTLKDDLCLDSLDIADLIVHLENKYKIEFDGETMPSIASIQDVAAYAYQCTQAKYS